MKLAEALNARKELEARLTRLEERLHASARVQEGLEPDESPDALYAMLEKTAAELVEIVSRISCTNVETVVEGRILADWIAERDVSWRRLRVLQSALRAAAPSYDRHGGPAAMQSSTRLRFASTRSTPASSRRTGRPSCSDDHAVRRSLVKAEPPLSGRIGRKPPVRTALLRFTSTLVLSRFSTKPSYHWLDSRNSFGRHPSKASRRCIM